MYRILHFVEDDFFGRVLEIEFSKRDLGEEYVYLLGNFNAFNEGSFRMEKKGRRFITRILLPEGVWFYLFSTKYRFILDEENPEVEYYKKESYKFNSKVNVCKAIYPENNIEDLMFHRPTPLYIYTLDGKTALVKLRISKDKVPKDVFIVANGIKMKMEKIAEDRVFIFYEAMIPVKDRLEYSFIVEYFDDTVKYGEFSLSVSEIMKSVKIPNWIFDIIVYQIMVDRFAPQRNTPDSFGHFGGNFKGLMKNFGHLIDLGINALYLTPIYKSKTYHSYDVEDHFLVDEKYGGNGLFSEFVNKCHEYDIKIFLDGVFHHTSAYHKFFIDVLRNGKNSKYFRWYRIFNKEIAPKEFIDKILHNGPKRERACYSSEGQKWYYESFFNVWIMPRLNHENDDVVKYVKDVVRFWIENYGISGWRIDVAHGVPPDFWRKIFSDYLDRYYIFGEVMDDGRIWIHKKFNGLMNYALYEVILEFFVYGRISAEHLLNEIMLLRAYYGPYEHSMYNFLDNHDVSRFLGLLGGDVDKYACSLAFLFTYPGVPAIFYGDEIGLSNLKINDEEQRVPMIWDKNLWNWKVYNIIKRLIEIRKRNVEFRKGIFIPIEFSGRKLDYIRKYGKSISRVIINYGDNDIVLDISDKNHEILAYNNAEIGDKVMLKGYSFIIFKIDE